MNLTEKTKNHLLLGSAVFGMLVAFPMAFYQIGKSTADSVSVTLKEIEVPVIKEVKIDVTRGVPLKDLDLMATTIYYEAGNEINQGQLAVGHIINNRYKFDESCGSIAEVVKESFQFSMWNPSDPSSDKAEEMVLNPQKIENKDINIKKYSIAWKAAYDVLTGESKDMTGGSTMYLNPDVLDKLPDWFKACQNTIQIGNHHMCYYDMNFCKK